MKKLFSMLLAVAFLFNAGMLQAQSTPATTQKAPAATTAKHMKADGTPDKRYKENKTATPVTAKPAGPVKKDGTPDMRYKANKPVKASKPVTAAPVSQK